MKRYGKNSNKEHKHLWGEPIGHDHTQFCKLCNQWRCDAQ